MTKFILNLVNTKTREKGLQRRQTCISFEFDGSIILTSSVEITVRQSGLYERAEVQAPAQYTGLRKILAVEPELRS